MPDGFSNNFMWGVATSAYQIEGAVNADGRGVSIWDTFSKTPGKTKNGDTGEVACDHYHRYVDDVQIIRSLGVGHYRFSTAWPRILPDGRGRVNPAGLDFYDRLLDELLKAGIKPWLTLYHWDLPQTLQDGGGWANRSTAQAFADYTTIMAQRLGDRVYGWITHNEPWCTTLLGHYIGEHAPGKRDLATALQASHHVLYSHGLAVQALRAAVPEARVGITLNFAAPYPASQAPADLAAAQRYDGYFNRWFLDPLAGRGYPEDMWAYYAGLIPQAGLPHIAAGDLDVIAAPLDFLGVNYYDPIQVADDPHSNAPGIRSVPNPGLELTADREIDAAKLYALLMRLSEQYPFSPLIITENGAAFFDAPAGDGRVHDEARIGFLQAHLEQVAKAVADGAPVEGYFVWSLMDNFEWAAGYDLRYGIVYVDYASQARIVKDSGHWYRRFIQGE